jgi:hypothetical protein
MLFVTSSYGMWARACDERINKQSHMFVTSSIWYVGCYEELFNSDKRYLSSLCKGIFGSLIFFSTCCFIASLSFCCCFVSTSLCCSRCFVSTSLCCSRCFVAFLSFCCCFVSTSLCYSGMPAGMLVAGLVRESSRHLQRFVCRFCLQQD